MAKTNKKVRLAAHFPYAMLPAMIHKRQTRDAAVKVCSFLLPSTNTCSRTPLSDLKTAQISATR